MSKIYVAHVTGVIYWLRNFSNAYADNAPCLVCCLPVPQVLDILTVSGCGASPALRQSLASAIRLTDGSQMASNRLRQMNQVSFVCLFGNVA